jgi:hypothetical protein
MLFPTSATRVSRLTRLCQQARYLSIRLEQLGLYIKTVVYRALYPSCPPPLQVFSIPDLTHHLNMLDHNIRSYLPSPFEL